MSKKTDKEVSLDSDTEASLIWNEIKDRNIEMFALPAQKVAHYCKPINIEPSKLYLRITASSVLPSLETACGSKFVVELLDKYVTVTRTPEPISPK